MVHCTPGLIHLHYSTSSPQTPTRAVLRWQAHSLKLKTYPISTASSALHPPSGFTYLDQLIIALSDGSINVLHGLRSGHPQLMDDAGDILLLEWEKVLSHIKACKSEPLQQAIMLIFADIERHLPILFSMHNGKQLDLVYGKALEVLRSGPTDLDDMKLDIELGGGRSAWKGKACANTFDNDKNIREGFRRSISKH